MGYLLSIDTILESDAVGAEAIKQQLKAVHGTVAQELKNIVWKEYLGSKTPQG